jgi:hypothetical protein
MNFIARHCGRRGHRALGWMGRTGERLRRFVRQRLAAHPFEGRLSTRQRFLEHLTHPLRGRENVGLIGHLLPPSESCWVAFASLLIDEPTTVDRALHPIAEGALGM